MPQKSNPVAAEALVTLARLNAGDLALLHQSLVHTLERDGMALGVEWTVLPAMLERAAASLRISQDLAEMLRPEPDRIATAFSADRGMMLAEAAGFVLARDMPRTEAIGIVDEALRVMQDDPALILAEALLHLAPGHDWAGLLRPGSNAGETGNIARNDE